MSSLTVYANEPSTRGKVVLHTSLGPLDVELWSKEAPLACRNFVQLGMEGYYDGCIFHRVIKDFMAQTGDPTGTNRTSVLCGTGKGGECALSAEHKNERLLGMASSGPDTNKSQFFVTLDRCEWLDNKHTIFGKVTGNSIYNLNRFNEVEVGEHDRPTYPPRILRMEVLLEPFDDIVPRPSAVAPPPEPAAKKRRKGVKNLSLLSFGEEAANASSQLPDPREEYEKLRREIASKEAER
ncbi:Petidyl-prolyl cis-trans isomerase putative cyclophilin involved in protein folding and posttranslational modification [Emiliania huxleyi CCMP1516]|uniref:Peptidyl-prolyl cis-trans isomerase n=2 Tax=Emiliania huxleyi TaxID=2903 RepID=A0A0D3JL75_EMIH1|nr:Petidyl-prolyl cis-trans isomerase putative cyclophilin involved in protein folding and posttranslational modification [Emiliania huxleyi CCMP1516]EOD24260.1 Petidyl-prolyl cis-trans isomerase putative cyclophilin involved in protein folding and posttranslational modification [Emiliania huxleyi CCMP1516]|eukprot:XP_005776689.1 Petidyl-prolyl cis-trans isomerase putative cyclophilin involved in protein folding and posttranslational modification [Emiliania huxleyi CCMP1516]